MSKSLLMGEQQALMFAASLAQRRRIDFFRQKIIPDGAGNDALHEATFYDYEQAMQQIDCKSDQRQEIVL